MRWSAFGVWFFEPVNEFVLACLEACGLEDGSVCVREVSTVPE